MTEFWKRAVAALVYALGVGVLGAAIGLFVGLSKTSVVALVLPLLFGLIGGAGLFLPWLNGTSGPAPWSPARSYLVVGGALVAFGISAIGGAMYGISLRSERTWSEWFPHPSIPDAATFAGLTAPEAADLVVFGQLMDQMGVDRDTRTAFLASIAGTTTCTAIYQPLIAAVGPAVADEPATLAALREQMDVLQAPTTTVANARSTIDSVATALSRLVFDEAGRQWLAQRPAIATAIQNLMAQILRISACSGIPTALNGMIDRLRTLKEVALVNTGEVALLNTVNPGAQLEGGPDETR